MADPVQKPSAECQAYIIRLENALSGIGDLVGVSLGSFDPDTIRRRVKDILTEHDAAQARAKELEAKLDTLKLERHNETLRSGERIQWFTRRCADLEAEAAAWQKNHEALRVKMVDLEKVIAHDVANSAAHDMRIKELEGELEKLKKTLEAARSATQTYASAEIKANNRAVKAEARAKELEAELLKVRAAKCLDEMDASTGMVVTTNADPARTALYTIGEILGIYNRALMQGDCTPQIIAAVKGLQDEVSAVWELWGAGRPMTPGCVYDAALEMEQANTKLHMKLGAIAEMLSYAGIPTHYGADQQGGAIPLPERVAVLIIDNADADQIDRAHAGLDDLGAPRQAGSVALDLSARIRALPGLLRQD